MLTGTELLLFKCTCKDILSHIHAFKDEKKTVVILESIGLLFLLGVYLEPYYICDGRTGCEDEGRLRLV